MGNHCKIITEVKVNDDNIELNITGSGKNHKIDFNELSLLLSQMNGIKGINRKGGQYVKVVPCNGVDENGFINSERISLQITNLDLEEERGKYNYFNPRPSMLDYALSQKFSEKPLVDYESQAIIKSITGAILLQFLKQEKIYICSHIQEIGNVRDCKLTTQKKNADMMLIRNKDLRVFSDSSGKNIIAKIKDEQQQKNSVGGIIDCVVQGLPVGTGRAGNGIDGVISKYVFGIPDVKGIEFGNGFNSAKLTGIDNNDGFCLVNDSVKTITNNDGGIIFGVANGMDIDLSVAFRPTPLIGMKQNQLDINKKENSLSQNDCGCETCFVTRACPIVESFVAMALYELLYGAEYIFD